MRKFMQIIQQMMDWGERFFLSFREDIKKEYGFAKAIILAFETIVILALLIILFAQFGVIILLVILLIAYAVWKLYQYWLSQQNDLAWKLAETVASTVQRVAGHFGLDRPQMVNDVLPKNRSVWDNTRGFTEYHFVVYTLKDELDCEAFKDLLQRVVERTFAGSTKVVIVEKVRPSLFESRGYDIVIVINPPKGWDTSSGSDGCDLMMDDEL